MNLATMIKNTSIINAGGPGSGRHKEISKAQSTGSIIERSGLSKEQLAEHPRTVKTVNKILQKLGIKEKLAYGSKDAEVYWYDGKADGFFEQSVGVARPSHLSVGNYLRDLDYRLKNDRNVGTEFAKNLEKRYGGNIKAGGPGSGCKGPNCGRPGTEGELKSPNLKSMSHKERVEYLRKYISEHTQVGDKPKNTAKPQVTPTEKIYPHSGKGSMGVGKHPDVTHEERLGKITGPAGKSAIGSERKNAPAPFYRKSMDEAEVAKEKAGQSEMRDWQKQNQPQAQVRTNIQNGDEVKTLKVTKAFDNDKLEFKQYKPGTTLTVINVLPKVGNNPQLMVAQYPGRQGDMVHMPVTDVRLHRTLEGIQEKPAYKIREEIGLTKGIRPGKIAQQIETPSGATYIKLKPESAGRPSGSGNLFKQGQPNPDEHSLKGKFSTAIGPKGNRLKEVFTFDTNLKSFGQGTARATVWDASKTPRTPDQAKHGTEGTTVIAWRDTKNKIGKVMEFDKDVNGYIKQGSKPMQLFNNLGKMGGYLKQRYGISMKLPGESVAKKGRKK